MKRTNHILDRDGEVRKLKNLQLGGNGNFIEVLPGERINFKPSTNVTLSRTKETDVNGLVTHHISISSSGGTGGTFTAKRGTVLVTTSITLNAAEHDQMTLICKAGGDITITVPTGLGDDFDCNLISEAMGTKWVQIAAGTGMTMIAPHGAKLLDGYTANIVKRTGMERINVQGELTP